MKPRMTHTVRTLCLAVVLMVLGGCLNGVLAQWEIGPSLEIALPQNQFDEVTDVGSGLNMKGFYRIRSVPQAALRADLAFTTYKYGQYIESGYVVETRTQSIRLTVGPQLSVRHRRVELYAAPMYGLYYFYTQDDIMWTYLTRTRNSNSAWGWNIGGGVMIDIAHLPKQRFDLALDVGGTWHSVTQGFETDLDMEGTIVHVKRDVEELCIHAGVVFRFR